MSLIPAMFQFVRKLVGASADKRVAFAPLATPLSNDDFLFMNTEIFRQDPTKYYAEALEFSQKANSVMKDSLIWEAESTDFVYDKWHTIMNHARLIESREFTVQEKAAQENAKKVLFTSEQEPTAEFNAYKKRQEDTSKAAAALASHQASKPEEGSTEFTVWAQQFASLQAEFADSELKWKALGFKDEIEKALKAFDQPKVNVDRNIFAAQWRDAKSFLETVKAGSPASGSDIFPMSCTPNNLYEYKGTKWTPVTLNNTQIAQLTADLTKEVKGIDTNNVFGTEPIELESVSFEICRVIFTRSWLNESLLISRNWDFNEGKVATGEVDNFDGILPAYPVEFILVKNVQTQLKAGSPANDDVQERLKAGESVFIGPFIMRYGNKKAGNSRLKAQTFTNTQLKTMGSSVETTAGGSAATTRTQLRRKGLQQLRKIRVGQGREATAAGRVLARPIVREHRDTPPAGIPARPGFVWVVDHWEREKARPKELPKVKGTVIDQDGQTVDDAEVTLLSGAVLLNDISDNNGLFSIENVAAGDYHLTVKKEGYADVEKDIKVTSPLDVGKISLSSKHPQESFLLLGVVYRKLPKLPNPIDGESYV